MSHQKVLVIQNRVVTLGFGIYGIMKQHYRRMWDLAKMGLSVSAQG
jgi:hypothetical protein